MNAKEKASVSRGFDAGNYDSAYVSEDFSVASRKRNLRRKSRLYQDAYLLGFFSSYEISEIREHRAAWNAAMHSAAGKQCIASGYIDASEHAPKTWEDEHWWVSGCALSDGRWSGSVGRTSVSGEIPIAWLWCLTGESITLPPDVIIPSHVQQAILEMRTS